MHADQAKYIGFTGPARLNKAINTLLGIVTGITIDGEITDSEIVFLNDWMSEHRRYSGQHPFTEIFSVLNKVLADGVVTDDERDDIIWVCEKLQSTEYYNEITAGLQSLHAILGSVMADGKISEDELRGIQKWMDDRQYMRSCWPYDEVESLIAGIMADGQIDDAEHKRLTAFFSEFVSVLDDNTITNPIIQEKGGVSGLCAVCPEISFPDRIFCFTGSSSRFSRKEFRELVASLGGGFSPTVTKKINYLVIGADGNPCWAYSCYGRKVEKAVQLRKSGSKLQLIHENDFNDAIADAM